MKGIIVSVLITFVFVATAFAGEFGPPEPLGNVGQFTLGTGVWEDRSKMSLDGDHLGDRSSQYYLQGDYTFLKDWEVYGRLGSADQRLYSHDLQQRFTDGGDVFGTIGFKGVFFRQGNFALGTFVEGSLYGDHNGVTTNQWDANVGLSAQYKIPVGSRDLTLYGGPFAYVHRAEADFVDSAVTGSDEMSERHNLGGFLGVKVPVVQQKLFLTVEAQMRDRLSTGASLSYAF
ncbi:MAG: hypothetical protein ABSD38_33640 [Syntrophorhabdales bacterium]|jgi:hypothetical protein